jgi:hypothetical protein
MKTDSLILMPKHNKDEIKKGCNKDQKRGILIVFWVEFIKVSAKKKCEVTSKCLWIRRKLGARKDQSQAHR